MREEKGGNVRAWPAAADVAARAHEHQHRKDGRTPYFAHPVRVAMTCAVVFGCTDETVLTAALLHDTIEDTGTDYDELQEQFGSEIADVVAALSKDMRRPEPQREPEYDAQLARASWKARLIKLADVYDNFHAVDGEKARRKMREKICRAIALAEGDPECRTAVAVVRGLLEK